MGSIRIQIFPPPFWSSSILHEILIDEDFDIFPYCPMIPKVRKLCLNFARSLRYYMMHLLGISIDQMDSEFTTGAKKKFQELYNRNACHQHKKMDIISLHILKRGISISDDTIVLGAIGEKVLSNGESDCPRGYLGPVKNLVKYFSRRCKREYHRHFFHTRVPLLDNTTMYETSACGEYCEWTRLWTND